MRNMMTPALGGKAPVYRILGVIAALAAAAALTACGSKSGGLRYALVCGPGGTASGGAVAALESGISSYASEKAYPWKTYTASAAGNDAVAAQIKAASGDGAAYVIACGGDMEIPVYSAQSACKDVRFVLVDGEPRKNDNARSSIRSNTECVTCDRKSMGFLAGSTAVREGYTNIVWFSGRRTEAGDEYYEGFLNGVGYAARSLGVSTDSLTLTAEFAGTDELSPLRMEEAEDYYESGAQLIITDQVKIAEAVRMAAENLQKPFATVGFDAMSSSENIQFSALPNYEGLIRSLLMSFEEHKGFEGGSSLVCGAAQSAVRLAAEYARMPVVTEVDTQTVLAAMATGQAAVSNDETSDTVRPLGPELNVTLKEPGEETQTA